METKKKSANWYIAATHWLTAGFIIPLLGIIILMPLLGYIFISLFGEDRASGLLQISILLLWPFIIWLGVKYSASYCNKKYVIESTKEIVILSTLYLAITRGLFMGYQIFAQGLLTMNHLISVITVIVFYLASKKYIKQSAIERA